MYLKVVSQSDGLTTQAQLLFDIKMKKLEKDFWSVLGQSETFLEILDESEKLKVPHWHFGAGFIAQTIWNIKLGHHANRFINDVDWVYFDPYDLSEESEKQIQLRVSHHFQHIPLRFDVKNQARVHLWYEKKFGTKISPYSSIFSAIENWPTTSTAIGVTKIQSVQKVFAPLGLEDVMSLKVRPNKKLVAENIYAEKVKRWKKNWPELNVIDW